MTKEPTEQKEDFKPYVSPDARMPEVTVLSVVTGIILLIIFGAANAYLASRLA